MLLKLSVILTANIFLTAERESDFQQGFREKHGYKICGKKKVA